MESKKDFDCVEMKRKAQERIRQETEGMTREQELEYWRKKDEAFRLEVEAARAAARKAS